MVDERDGQAENGGAAPLRALAARRWLTPNVDPRSLLTPPSLLSSKIAICALCEWDPATVRAFACMQRSVWSWTLHSCTAVALPSGLSLVSFSSVSSCRSLWHRSERWGGCSTRRPARGPACVPCARSLARGQRHSVVCTFEALAGGVSRGRPGRSQALSADPSLTISCTSWSGWSSVSR